MSHYLDRLYFVELLACKYSLKKHIKVPISHYFRLLVSFIKYEVKKAYRALKGLLLKRSAETKLRRILTAHKKYLKTRKS